MKLSHRISALISAVAVLFSGVAFVQPAQAAGGTYTITASQVCAAVTASTPSGPIQFQDGTLTVDLADATFANMSEVATENLGEATGTQLPCNGQITAVRFTDAPGESRTLTIGKAFFADIVTYGETAPHPAPTIASVTFPSAGVTALNVGEFAFSQVGYPTASLTSITIPAAIASVTLRDKAFAQGTTNGSPALDSLTFEGMPTHLTTGASVMGALDYTTGQIKKTRMVFAAEAPVTAPVYAYESTQDPSLENQVLIWTIPDQDCTWTWNGPDGTRTALWGPGGLNGKKLNGAYRTLHFVAEGAQDVPDDIQVPNDGNGTFTAAIPATAPTKPGYKFQYWTPKKTVDGGSTQIKAGDQMSVAETDDGVVTMTAFFEEIQMHTVTFAAGVDGSWPDGAVTTQQVADGDPASTPAVLPVRAGHHISGWSDSEGNEWNFEESTVADDTTITAVWAPDQVTVAFDSAGGSNVDGKTGLYGGTVADPGNPTRDNYTFQHWTATDPTTGKPIVWDFASSTLTQANGVPIDPSTLQVSGPLTLTAVWAGDAAIVEFNVNFDHAPSSVPDIPDFPGHFGGTVTLPDPDPERTGYTFSGWAYDAAGSQVFDPNRTLTESKTILYAQWDPKDVIVKFDSAGGTTVDDVPGKFDGTITEPEAKPTRTGYTFDGWFIDIPDSPLPVPFFSDDYTITLSDGTGAEKGIVTLTAHWTANKYTLTFDVGEGDVADVPSPEEITYPAPFTEPDPKPTKTGYTFVQWVTTKDGTTPFDFTKPHAENLTAYAQWKPDTLTLTFDTGAGTTVDPVEFDYGTAPKRPETIPTRTDDWVFVDWYVAPTGIGLFDFDTPRTESVIAYAHWRPVNVTVTWNSNGGTPISTPTQTFPFNTSVDMPVEKPTRAGYTFLGWGNLSGDLGRPLAFPQIVREDTTYYAKWQGLEYSLTLDAQAGTFPDGATTTQKVTFPERFTTPTEADRPTRTGYTFDKWVTEPGGDTPFAFAYDPTSPTSQTAYAKWTKNTYTVSFDSKGGPEVKSITAEYGDSLGVLPNPTRPGYQSVAWTKTDNGNDIWNPFTDRVTSDITLYAQWLGNLYVATFDSQGGTPATTTQPKLYPNLFTPPSSAPTKAGYTFGGWYTDTGATAAFDFTKPHMGNVTLYAKWAADPASITYNPENGADQPTTLPGNTGDPIPTIDDPSRTGYTFAGWYTAAQGGTKLDLTQTMLGDMQAYAQWQAKDVTLNFKDSATTTWRTETGKYDEPTPEPTDKPSRTGYDFKGWAVDAAGSADYDFDKKIDTEDPIDIFARWAAQERTVTFLSEGKVFSTFSGTYDGAVAKPADPTRDGFGFAGWTIDEGGATLFDFDHTTLTEDLTLYAQWTANTYTLSFDVGEGDVTNAPSADVITYPATFTEPTTKPTKPGYTFVQWVTTKDGTTAFDFTKSYSKDTTAYAQWEIESYTVTFDAAGGEYGPATQTVVYKGFVKVPTPPVRAGYTFKGWMAAGEVVDLTKTPITGATTFTAKWEAQPATVRFILDGGSAIPPQTGVTGDEITRPATPTKTGYRFDDWYTTDAYDVKFDFANTTMRGDMPIYGRWIANDVTVRFHSEGEVFDTFGGKYDGLAVQPTVPPTRAGYAFMGWFPTDEGGVEFDFTQKLTGDLDLYAQWKAVGPTDHDPETGDLPPVDVKPGEDGKTPTDPKDWKDDKGDPVIPGGPIIDDKGNEVPDPQPGEVESTVDDSKTVGPDCETGAITKTVTSVWTRDQQTATWTRDYNMVADTLAVSYDNAKGNADKLVPTTVFKGCKLTLPTGLTAEGFAFDGWTVAGEPTTSIEKVEADVAATAVWKTTGPTDRDPDTGDLPPVDVKPGEDGKTPTDPEDWKGDDGQPVIPGGPITDDNGDPVVDPKPEEFKNETTATTPVECETGAYTQTVKTTWTREDRSTSWERVYNLTADKMAVTYANAKGNADKLTPATVFKGCELTLPTGLTAEGFAFDGWTVNDKPTTSIAKVEADVAATAVWKTTGPTDRDPDTGDLPPVDVKPGEDGKTPTDPEDWKDDKGDPVIPGGDITDDNGDPVIDPDPTEFTNTLGDATPVDCTTGKYTQTVTTTWTRGDDSTSWTRDYNMVADTLAVSYDNAKGNADKLVPTEVFKGCELTLPTGLTAEGFAFDGWTVGGTATTTIDKVEADVAATAVWKTTGPADRDPDTGDLPPVDVKPGEDGKTPTDPEDWKGDDGQPVIPGGPITDDNGDPVVDPKPEEFKNETTATTPVDCTTGKYTQTVTTTWTRGDDSTSWTRDYNMVADTLRITYAETRGNVDLTPTTFFKGCAVDLPTGLTDDVDDMIFSGWTIDGTPATSTAGQTTDVTATSQWSDPYRFIRYSGKYRMDTARLANQDHPATGDIVFIATAYNFPDALSVSPAAARNDAALYLIKPEDGIDAKTLDAISKSNAKEVYIVGGKNAVPLTVEAQLKAIDKFEADNTIHRFAGKDRAETSAMIAEKFFPDATEAFIATGMNFPDALAGGPLAAYRDAPILLVDPTQTSTLNERQLAAISKASMVTLLGASRIVPDSFADTFVFDRIWGGPGGDRFDTAAAISRHLPETAKATWVVTGRNFPDALIASSIAGREFQPVLLSERDQDVPATAKALERFTDARTRYTVGGDVAILDGPAKVTFPEDYVEKIVTDAPRP